VKRLIIVLLIGLAVFLVGSLAYVPLQWQIRQLSPSGIDLDELREEERRLLQQARNDPEVVRIVNASFDRTRRLEAGEWVPYEGESPDSRWGWSWSRAPMTRVSSGNVELEFGERVRWLLVFVGQGVAVLLAGVAIVAIRQLRDARLRMRGL